MMTNEDEFEWTPDERAELSRLPRERKPDPLLKDRVRESLRTRGKLRVRGRSVWLRVAAGIVLFAGGVIAGRLTTGAAPHGFIAATDSLLAPAEHVQAAGSAYVETVARLVALRDSLPAGTTEQGRGAAISALRGAAEYASRLPGLDTGTVRTLAALRRSDGT